MFKRVILYLLAAVLGIGSALGVSQIFSITQVSGTAMLPEIRQGSTVLINKWSYRKEEPQVGQLVAFKSDIYGEEGEGRVLVRRIAAIGGDTVEIRDDLFYRNERPDNEHQYETVPMEDLEKITLKEGELFLLSDNRKSSLDSRNEAIGIIKTEDCIGKVCFR